MLVRLGVFAAVLMAGALMVSQAPASAQAGCAESDLKCRIERLEAKLAIVESQAAATEAATAKVAVMAAPKPFEVVRTWQPCRGNSCAAEATKICTSSGFASGKPDKWQRERSGTMILMTAECAR